MLSRCFLYFSVGEGAFVIGLSQISSISSFNLELLCFIVDRERALKCVALKCFSIHTATFAYLSIFYTCVYLQITIINGREYREREEI